MVLICWSPSLELILNVMFTGLFLTLWLLDWSGDGTTTRGIIMWVRRPEHQNAKARIKRSEGPNLAIWSIIEMGERALRMVWGSGQLDAYSERWLKVYSQEMSKAVVFWLCAINLKANCKFLMMYFVYRKGAGDVVYIKIMYLSFCHSQGEEAQPALMDYHLTVWNCVILG